MFVTRLWAVVGNDPGTQRTLGRVTFNSQASIWPWRGVFLGGKWTKTKANELKGREGVPAPTASRCASEMD